MEDRDWEEESKTWCRGTLVCQEIKGDYQRGSWDEGNDPRID